jgi:hypothetical protein
MDEYCPVEINVMVEMLEIAKRLNVFTADNFHVLDPSLDLMGLNHSVYGSNIAACIKEGKFEFIKYVKSTRETAHYRIVGLYRYIWG